jgi:hypothetical protein
MAPQGLEKVGKNLEKNWENGDLRCFYGDFIGIFWVLLEVNCDFMGFNRF